MWSQGLVRNLVLHGGEDPPQEGAHAQFGGRYVWAKEHMMGVQIPDGKGHSSWA